MRVGLRVESSSNFGENKGRNFFVRHACGTVVSPSYESLLRTVLRNAKGKDGADPAFFWPPAKKNLRKK